MLFDLFGERRSLPNTSLTLSSSVGWDVFGFAQASSSGEKVTEHSALGIPAIWAAVNVIAGTIAHLPFHLYRTDKEGVTSKADNVPLYSVIHDQANDIHTAYVWRKWLVIRLLLDGRSISLIVRDRANKPVAFVPIDLTTVTVNQKVVENRLVRTYSIGNQTYKSSDVLDFVLMPKLDCAGHYWPLDIHKDTIGQMIAALKYASTLFANGGVPPLALGMPPSSPAAMERASDDMAAALSAGRDRKRSFLPVPPGFEIKNIGFNPQEQQMLGLRQWMVSEASRIFNIAPAMLHDLTTGTYSNVEQQNLNYSQHTISPLVELIEQEMNSKLFGPRNTSSFVEFNLDGLQRGDFTTRMNGLARAIQTSLLTPNEGRALDNRPPLAGGDVLLIQGATIPLTKAGETPAPAVPSAPSDPNNSPETDEK